MAGSPPNLPVPKGWKPPPGTNKPITKYVPKPPSMKGLTGASGPYSKPPTGPGYGVLRPGVRSAPAPRPAPSFKPEGRLFSGNNKPSSGGIFGRPLYQATRENFRTGAAFEQYKEQHPKVAQRQYESEHHVGLLGKALGLLGEGERGLESGAISGINALGSLPGVTGKFGHLESPGEQRAVRGLYGKAGVGAATTLLPFGVARGLTKAADVAETARAGKTLTGLAEREGIDTAARSALRGAPATSGTAKLAKAAEVGVRQPTAASRALKVGAAAAGGYGKLLATATPAKAAIEATPEPKKHESFVEHLYRTSANTVANFPAGVVETAKHPLSTLEAMGQMYSHPQHAFEENPLGAALAFLAPYGAIERGGGAVIRAASKDKWLSQERASLAYPVGIPRARTYQPGAITQAIQRLPDAAMKRVGKGEKPLYSDIATKKTYNEATKLQAKRDLIGSRLGGIVHPGQIDQLHGGERTARNLDTMAGRHFLSQHLGTDELHNDALLTLLQGEAKTAKSFWPDVAERLAGLRERAHNLTHEDRALNQKQIEKLERLEQGKAKLSTEDLGHLEQSAGEIAQEQARLWRLANKEGVGHEDQLNARNVGALLLHGHLMGRGDLRYVREPDLEFMDGPRKPNGRVFPGIYDSHGNRVNAPDVQQFLGGHFNGRELGFLNHKVDQVMARSNNMYGPRTIFAMRTGGHFLNGTYDNSAAALRGHFDTMAHNISAMRGSRSVIEHMVLPGENGNWMNEQDAKAAAKARNFSPEGEALKPHLGQWVVYPVGAHKVADLIEGSPFGRALEHAGTVEGHAQNQEAGIYGITPEKIANRLTKWQSVESHLQHGYGRMLTSPWRQTNLYTSIRWPFGTTQENAIRLAAHRVSPLAAGPFGSKYTSLSFKTGSQITKLLDEKIHDPQTPPMERQLAIYHRSMLGTGSFAGAQLHELQPAIDTLQKNDKLTRFSESKLNLPNRAVWKPWRKFVGGSLNRMETNAKMAAGGKLALNDAGFFDKFRAISREQAAHDYVAKITGDPGESIRAGEKLLEVMGNWTHLTPTTRGAQAAWAPFALWWLNSAKFVLQTMPRDHPLATGLLAAMITATGQENKNVKPWMEGTVPLTLPLLGKIDLNPVHYSPFDIGREVPQTAAGMVLPQVQEPLSTIKGVNYLTGEKFEGEKIGEGSELTGIGRVGVNAMESFVPGTRFASQIAREGGKQPKNAVFPWEIKPGTGVGVGKTLAKALSPAMFTYPKKEKTEGGSIGWGNGGWGKAEGGWGKGGW